MDGIDSRTADAARPVFKNLTREGTVAAENSRLRLEEADDVHHLL